MHAVWEKQLSKTIIIHYEHPLPTNISLQDCNTSWAQSTLFDTGDSISARRNIQTTANDYIFYLQLFIGPKQS